MTKIPKIEIREVYVPKIRKPRIVKKGKFGEDGWSISISDVDKDE